jgi:hypothetical protein
MVCGGRFWRRRWERRSRDFASWHQYVRPAGLIVAVLLVCGALFLAAIGANWLARQFVRHGRR